MKKSASILDYSHPSLDPAIWDQDMKLFAYQKDFILRLITKMYETYSFKQPELWVEDIVIIGSLTTSKWLFTSDLDVHIRVNLEAFRASNMPQATPEEAFNTLDETRKKFDRAKILAPMTQHPIEFYFESVSTNPSNIADVGVYSVIKDAWLKEPILLPADLDFEQSKKDVVAQAEALAQSLDVSFGKIQRDIQRIDELETVIKAWGQDKQQLFYQKVEQKLHDIEAELAADLKLRQDLVDARHADQDATSDVEIKFKWLARFGFFSILGNLKTLLEQTGGQITTTELPLIDKIISAGSLKEAFLKEAFEKETDTDICVDLDKTIAKPAKFPAIGDPIDGAKEGLKKLQDMGYSVIIYSCRADTEEGVDTLREYLDKHDLPYDSIFEGEKPFAKFYIDDHAIRFDNWDNVLKQVEKSDKKASLRIAALYDKYWIDPSGKEFVLNGEGHLEWIYKNMLGPSPDMSRGDIEADALEKAEEMISGGWTRVTTESSNGGEFALEVGSLKKVPPYLDNFIAQHYSDGMIEMDDSTGAYVEVDDPFPTLQRAVNKALRQPRVFSKLDVTAKTKKIKQGDYSCLMALVPHGLAQEIVEFGVRTIPDDKLYQDEDGKLGRELESHITVKYGLTTNDAKGVRRSFNNEKPYHAKLGKVRHFEPPESPFDVVTVEIISEDLEKANKRITEDFDCAEGLVSDVYHPHITIAYVKRGTAKDFIGSDDFEGKEIDIDTFIFSPHKGNRTYFSISQEKESNFILEKITKVADFLPSLFNAPDNDWQFAEGGPDKEIALQPDSVSDDTTEAEPCTTGKPRTKEVWRQFMSMFANPFSKKEDVHIDSAYDPKLEQEEKDALGEDQTLLEYSKGFYDPKKHDFPHNTTWDSLTQDGEPSKPTSVTYSPQSNEDNLDQNSPGGYPRRFMGKPKGEWFSNEGEVNNALIDMLRQRNAAIIEGMTKEAFLEHAYWIDPNGKVFEVRGAAQSDESHLSWIEDNLEMLQNQYKIKGTPYISTQTLVSNGWIRIGDGSGNNWQVQVQSLKSIPSIVDDVLAQFVPEGANVEFTDDANDFTVATYPFKNSQGAVNRALRMQQMPMAASMKQAGDQSASVPDYLINEWKTEQINDDTDEEPYINHDQRDYPFGMHDSPENTGTGIGWAKDNTPYVVRLDTLENPAYRSDPFGIGEYNVTWYTSLPASDGIEATNPE